MKKLIQREKGSIRYTAGYWPLVADRCTLVFIHGSAGSASLWDEQVRQLADVCNTISIDLPGHGQTGGDGLNSVPLYANVVKTFIDDIEAPYPVPCGLSLGGAIAQLLLIEHPDFFQGGILMGTGARLKVRPEIFEAIERDYNAFTESIGIFGASKKTEAAKLEPVIQAARSCRADTAAGDFRACNGFDVMDRLPTIRRPVLILSADEDRLTPSKYGDYLKKSIAKAELVMIPDAGHLMPVENPEAVNLAIRQFIARITIPV